MNNVARNSKGNALSKFDEVALSKFEARPLSKFE